MIDALWSIAPIIIAIALGYFAGFITAAVLAVSSEVSRWEDAQPVQPEPKPEPEPPIDAALAEAEAKADFYYRMATGQEAT